MGGTVRAGWATRPARAAAGLLVPLVAALGGPAALAMPVPDVLDADDPSIAEDQAAVERDLTGAQDADEDVVLAAQKVRRTVQDAPSIITVITREQIRRRGYRTINDVVRTVPGFEGDRWEGNGWYKEVFARGLPRTVLVLVNGVSIIEPVRNSITLDRKIPLELVERIEVTSGPGGVLWGSNALLGIINIVTRRPDDSGPHALVGFGDGPGDRLALKAGAGVSYRFGPHVGLFAHASFFSTEGPELELDAQKVVGSLPEPAEDTPTLYLPSASVTTAGKRSWFFNFAGRLEVGPFALDWMVPLEREYRAIATGGADLRWNYLTGRRDGQATMSNDSVRLVNLSYRDRFLDGLLGVAARAYFVQWDVEMIPFGVYAASPVLYAQRGQTTDLHLRMDADLVIRPGLAVDVDIHPLEWLDILTGGEVYVDISRGIYQAGWHPAFAGQCPAGYTLQEADAYLPCKAQDVLVTDNQRITGGAFLQLEARPFDVLALNAGLRVQASDTYEPALLYSGGLVWNIWDRIHLKIFSASGMRPPNTNATHVRDTTSGVSFRANPNLVPETSQSIEGELNAVLLRDLGFVRDLYLRANGAATFMHNVIGRPGGRYENSGERTIGSLEAVLRLRFQAGHELWANYTFTQVNDDSQPGGQLRNFARHMGNVGGRILLLDGHLEIGAVLTVKGPMSDPNRPAEVDPAHPEVSVSCAQLLATPLDRDDPLHSLRTVCAAPGMAEGVWVMPGTQVNERVPASVLLDIGVRLRNIWRDLSVGLFVHNLLDDRAQEPDFFGDPRVISRPQPKPGFSIYGEVSIGL